MHLTELALTLGTWGVAPPCEESIIEVCDHLARFAKRADLTLELEVYSEWQRDRATLTHLLALATEGFPVVPVVRLEPRNDRLKDLAKLGVKRIVFDIPISPQTAGVRYLPHGPGRAIEAAAQGVRDAALLGICSEVALQDIARARLSDVEELIALCEREGIARGQATRYRLVDSTGFASPVAVKRVPRSLAGWVRTLHRSTDLPLDRFSVQASDRMGLGLANLLSGIQEGAGAASSLFGLGMGAGWGSTEAMLFHTDPEMDIRGLISLRETLAADRMNASARAFSGTDAWEVPSDTTPEALHQKSDSLFGFDPKKRLGISPPPLLTPLSGHAGLLHLMHRHFPERHFESDDPRSLEISKQFEQEFAEGRQQPVCWAELEPKIHSAGLLD
ncbi:hypothetical protein KQI63_08550 [bacterium]|nr:hypothetical protein [bacterium]